MWGLGWQDLAVGAGALGALGWLVMRRLRRRKKLTPFCDSCPGCEAGNAPESGVRLPPQPKLIPISDLKLDLPHSSPERGPSPQR